MNQARFESVVSRLAVSVCSVTDACKEADITSETLYTWLWKRGRAFSDAFARAMEQHWTVIGNGLSEMAQVNPIKGDRSDSARVRYLEVRLELYKWLLSKKLPSIYGDKLALSADVTFQVPRLIEAAPIQSALRPGAPQQVVVASVMRSLKDATH